MVVGPSGEAFRQNVQDMMWKYLAVSCYIIFKLLGFGQIYSCRRQLITVNCFAYFCLIDFTYRYPEYESFFLPWSKHV